MGFSILWIFLRPLFYILFLIFRWIFIFQKLASTSGKRCTLSIEQKLEILEALKSKKPDDVAKDFNIGYSTVKRIRQNEEEIRKKGLNNGNLNRKRKRESPNEEIGETLIAWSHQMRAQNATINGPLMLEKAKQLAITLGHQDFEPSHGWLERLKSRHNIKFIKVSDERAAADQAGVKNWINNVLPGVTCMFSRCSHKSSPHCLYVCSCVLPSVGIFLLS